MTKLQKGVLAILFSGLAFATMSLCIRLAGNLPTFQKMLFRNSVAAVIAVGVIARHGGLSFHRVVGQWKNQPLLIGRAFLGTLVVFCTFYATEHMDMSDATMLIKTSPFFTIVFSAIFLKEKITVKQFLAVIVAFGGSLFIIKPSFNIQAIPGAVALLGGVSMGMAYVFVRRLRGREDSATVVAYFSIFATLFCSPPAALHFAPMSGYQVLICILLGISGVAAQLAVTLGYQTAAGRDISIYEYSRVVFAAIYDLLFFGAFPDMVSLIGYAVIFAATLWLFFYSRKHG
jgi:drug/metabolite transporter (DMT)-like permease